MADCQSLIRTLKGMSPGDVGYVDQLDKVFGCLNKRIGDLEGGFNKATQSAREFASAIGEGNDMVTSIFESFAKAQANAVKFATNIQRQYRLGEDIAESYKKVSVNIGIGYQNQRRLGDEFSKSLALVTEIGGDLSDVSAIYTRFAENSGRVRILDDEEVQRIFAIEQATGLMGDSAAALAERFDLIGIGSERFAENINQIVKDSQKIGLNSSKVVKVLSDNFESMQRMSFRGGVKAMTEMSKLAVKMRMDVSDMLGMADKFYNPEAAIEAASKLQLLGGDIASAFGDPFTIMYEARNKPEELAKRVQKMTENMIQFNEETGEYELPAEARMQFQALGDALGININNMVEMSRQTAKMKDVKMELSGTDLFSEEQMEGIANMARMTDDGFKVDLIGDDGKMIEKNIRDLTSGEVEMLLKPPPTQEELMKKEDKYMDEMVKNSMTTNEILKSINDQFKTAFVAENDVYKLMENVTKESIENVRDFGQEFGNLVQKKFDESFIKSSTDILSESTESVLSTYTEKIGQGFLSLFEGESSETLKGLSSEQLGGMFKDIKDFKLNMAGGVINITNENTSGSVNPNTSGKVNDDFLSRNDGTVTSFSSMDDIIGAKSGGPIDKLLNSVLPNKQTSVVEVKGNPKIDININSNNPNMNFTTEQMDQITSVALKSILSVFNNGGSVDGGSQSQKAKGFEQKLGKFG